MKKILYTKSYLQIENYLNVIFFHLKSERLLSDLTAFETGLAPTLAKPASMGELEDVSEDRVDPAVL